MNSITTEDLPINELDDLPVEGSIPTHVKKDLLHGTSALGFGVIIERACSFLANILAARLGGASNFGVYAVSLSTANNISAYAAGGIGSTAIRFSGEHPRGSAGYPTLTRVLAVISVVSAIAAASILWLGASPIARLLHKESLTGVLRWAAFSAAGIIILECCRGFLVGQRRIKALLLLSSLVGVGYLALLPAMSRFGATQMICSQGSVTIGAVLIILLLYRSLGLTSPVTIGSPEPMGPLLKRVWSFGFVQLASLMGMNAAGWWLTSLVARSDTSMVQMGYFAVAHQLRNIVALGPSLLTEGSLAVMAGPDGKVDKTPDNVMAMSSYACTFASFLMAGLGMIVVPWAITLLYGKGYAAAGTTVAIALATAVVHMGSAPISARLSIISIHTFGVINTAWAIFVAVFATAILFHGGNAAKGAGVYLAGHLFLATLQIATLNKRGLIPKGSIASFGTGTIGALVLAALAWAREVRAANAAWISLVMIGVLAATTFVLYLIGKQRNWMPSRQVFQGLLSRALQVVKSRVGISTNASN
jgi:O-antigen/teichoic acid export membrane protein